MKFKLYLYTSSKCELIPNISNRIALDSHSYDINSKEHLYNVMNRLNAKYMVDSLLEKMDTDMTNSLDFRCNVDDLIIQGVLVKEINHGY